MTLNKNNIQQVNENSDVAAERGILSSIFAFGNEGFLDVADLVGVNSFTLDSNQKIFEIIKYHFKNSKDDLDLPTFLSHSSAIGYKNFFESKEESSHLRAIMNFPIKKETGRKLASKVKKLEIARLLRNQLKESDVSLTKITGDEPIAHILGLVENPIFDFSAALNTNHTEGPQKILSDIEEYVKYLESNPVKQIGISTGFQIWDESIGGGLRRGSINIIASRSKVGKTTIACCKALNIMMSNIPVLMIDTEMSGVDHKHKMLANLSGVPINEIESGQFVNSSDKREKVRKAASLLKKLPYHYISASGQPFEETLAQMRRWVCQTIGYEGGQTKPCVIMYDWFKLPSSDSLEKGHLQETQLLGFMMTSLQSFLLRYEVPCISFIQLNRDGITREDTGAVSMSDRVLWFCGSLSMLKKQSEEEIAAQSGRIRFNRKLITLASRFGPAMDDGDYINVRLEGEFARMTEGPLRSNNNPNTNPNEGSIDDDGETPF